MPVPILVCFSIAVAFFLLCFKRPCVARIFTVFFLLGASLINSLEVLHGPLLYAEGYGPGAIDLFRQFIEGPFTRNPFALVPQVAAGQFTIAVLLLLKGSYRKLGLAGAMLFLGSVSLVGTSSGFLAHLVIVAGLVVLYRNETLSHSLGAKKQLDQPQHMFPIHTKADRLSGN